MFELRKEICRYLKQRFDLSYQPKENIIVTVGGSEAIDITMRAIINEGDEVIVLSPGYVAYEPSVVMAGGNRLLLS